MNYKLEGMTIAITNMESMLAFYAEVFGIAFKERNMFNSILYAGKWGDLDILFCPAALAQNTAIQNRHQFDIVVTDLQKMITLAKKYGGTLMGEISENEQMYSVGLYDPDNNSMVLKQLKNNLP